MVIELKRLYDCVFTRVKLGHLQGKAIALRNGKSRRSMGNRMRIGSCAAGKDLCLCLHRGAGDDRIVSMTEHGASFENIVPDHDDAGGDEFCNHVVDVGEVDEQPHEQLIEPEPRDARAEEEHFRTARLSVCPAKDTDEAEPVVDEDGDGEGDPC